MSEAGARQPLQTAALMANATAFAILPLPGTQDGVGLQKDHMPLETQGMGVRAQVSGSVMGRGSDIPVPLNGPL